jgi:hypothetical protein
VKTPNGAEDKFLSSAPFEAVIDLDCRVTKICRTELFTD